MTSTTSQRTLAQRMTESRIPVAEALHYAMSLAEALRKLHDAGKAHGAVAPQSIALTGTGIDLIPSLGRPAMITPYTAPELLHGGIADARSDIFSFGALVFEMLTGRRAFDGDGQTALTLALSNSAPPPSGSPAVDRLVAGCVAKDPAARWQRMQKILMELKLLTVAARRADAAPTARGASDATVRAEIQQLEARFAARLATHEKAVSESQQNSADSLKAVREQLAAVASQLATLQAAPAPVAVDTTALMQQLDSRVNQTVADVTSQLSALHEKLESVKGEVHAGVSESLSAAAQQHTARIDEAVSAATQQAGASVDTAVAAVNQRMALAEQNMEEIRKHFATLQANVAGDLHEFEQNLKTQTVSIDSARTAMAQTDDLVERVVEALELLQSSVLDQHDAVVN